MLRISSLSGLGESKRPEAVELLSLALEDADEDVREAAIAAPAKIGGDEAAQALAIALEDEDSSVREEAVETLEGLLGDEKPQVRQYALKALARIGKVNKERLQPIIEDPEEKDYNVSLARRLIKKARV